MPFSLAFLVLVLTEIALFIVVGGAFGVLATLGLVLFGMVAGVIVLRRQGVATLMRVRAEVEAGRRTEQPLAEGAAIAVAALLIVLPGFLTDLVGLALFVPAIRGALWRTIRRHATFATASQARPHPRPAPVIDLEESEYGATPRADSPWRPDRGPRA